MDNILARTVHHRPAQTRWTATKTILGLTTVVVTAVKITPEEEMKQHIAKLQQTLVAQVFSVYQQNKWLN